MILIKTADEIEWMRKSNLLVSRTLAEVAKEVKPGVSTAKLDHLAETFIRDHGAEPGFLGYQDYPKTLCTSLNSQVVHGIPSEKVILKEGDLVSVDCGVLMNGFYGDSAFSFEVGEVDKEVRKLLKTTRECLLRGVAQAVDGRRIGDVAFAIQQHAESLGFSVVREMVGHGLGRNMHEAPEVPNFGKRGIGPKLRKGMVICIEPMINMGRSQIKQESDGWTIRAADNLPSAHFELAVAIDKGEADILSTFSYIEEVLQQKV